MPNGDIEKYKILQNEYNCRDRLIVQEFSIGIAAVALLFNILLKEESQLLFVILIFIVGIIIIFTLIISLTKLGKVKYIVQEKMVELGKNINLKYIEDIKKRNKKSFLGRRVVTYWIRRTMFCLLIAWVVIGFVVIFNLVN